MLPKASPGGIKRIWQDLYQLWKCYLLFFLSILVRINNCIFSTDIRAPHKLEKSQRQHLGQVSGQTNRYQQQQQNPDSLVSSLTVREWEKWTRSKCKWKNMVLKTAHYISLTHTSLSIIFHLTPMITIIDPCEVHWYTWDVSRRRPSESIPMKTHLWPVWRTRGFSRGGGEGSRRCPSSLG